MKIQVDDLVRDANPSEIAVIEAQRAEVAAQIAATEAQLAARESARAKLAALGLTEAEVAALLGA